MKSIPPILLLALMLMGCGTLDRSLSTDELTAEDMAYLDQLPEREGYQYFDVGFQQYVTKKHAEREVYAPFLFGSETSAGALDNKHYLVRDSWSTVLASSSGTAMFDPQGNRVSGTSSFRMTFLGAYTSGEGKGVESYWELSLLPVPILGTMFRFGSGTFRFLWIDFVSPDDDDEPETVAKSR